MPRRRALGELQCRVDGAANGLHVIFHAQQEAGETSSPRCFTCVEEGRVAGWKRPEIISSTMSSASFSLPSANSSATMQTRSSKTLQVALTVEGLERVGGVET